MANLTGKLRRGYFTDDKGAAAFLAAFVRAMAQLQKVTTARYIPAENVQRFRHGGNWSHPGNPEAIGGEMQVHETGFTVRFDDLIDNNLGALVEIFRDAAESKRAQFAKMFYGQINQAVEKTGNIVDAQAEPSLPDALIAMLEKLEFTADKRGEVSLPQLHASPETVAKLAAAVEAMSPEQEEQIEAVKARKIEEAQAREGERKSRFVSYGK